MGRGSLSVSSTCNHILSHSHSHSHSHFIKPISHSFHSSSSFAFHCHPKLVIKMSSKASHIPVNGTSIDSSNDTSNEMLGKPKFNPHNIDPNLLQNMLYDALVWCSLHGLIIGDKKIQRSGVIPGVGMVHNPISLFPTSIPESQWKEACELAPIYNELYDRVSLDPHFIHDSLSRTVKADGFTSRLLDIHSKIIDMNKKEEIRLGLNRSDYMLDAHTGTLLQTEFNAISASSYGLSCRISELHKYLISYYGDQLELEYKNVPENNTVVQFAAAITEAWKAYNNPRAVVLIVIQSVEVNMYDQHWFSTTLREKYGVKSIRKTLGEIDAEGKLQPDGTLIVDGETVAVIYFRAGYAPYDYPSEAEWNARLLMEQSSAVKCPTIGYHLAGTKKVQQVLAKPDVLERFLDNKEHIAKLRKSFAGLWSLDDSKIVSDAIEKPELYVMKPQREGGGNNVYGDGIRETLQRMQKEGGTEEDAAAYILMQRIFPTPFPAFLVRDGSCRKEHAVTEIGVYGAYLRIKDTIAINEHCGYMLRTKAASADEGGVLAGIAGHDSLYLN